MQKFLRLALFLCTVAIATAAKSPTDIGDVTVTGDFKTIPIRVSASTPELNTLVQLAFNAHGLYKRVASGYTYDIRFTPVSSNSVRVDIARGSAGTPVASEVATGTTAANALLRAADIAVERTNGQGLKGFFSSKLAFISERTGKTEVYTSDLFFSPGTVKQITQNRALALLPRWSPDGTKLIYTSFYKSGFPDIYLLDVASGRSDVFMSVKGTNLGAHFSPNGQQVAMVLSGTGTSEIWVSNAQGRGLVRRTHSDATKSSPCFSPDGSRLVFASWPGPQLYVMPVSGGEPRRVTMDISRDCSEPDWSRANPNKIAFTMKVGGSYQIAVLDLQTGKSKQVSNAPFDGQEPTWLPDGRHLVYTARNATSSALCILDTETGHSVVISQSLGSCLQASVLAQ